MFGSLGPLEIGLIVLAIVLVFGVGKFSSLGRDLGTSIKEFRRAVKDEDDKPQPPVQQSQQYTPPQQQPPQQQYTPPPAQQQAPPPAQGDQKNPNVF
ncbi:MAG: twin-arginine translocase TatA/TatE family subunit [Dehalococcoidia bacterium]|nr:twin-arginine translocase TatA/TatE family subunit [Dehalococcoidia bacterium]